MKLKMARYIQNNTNDFDTDKFIDEIWTWIEDVYFWPRSILNSAYDKTLAFLSSYNIDYLFCNAFWCDYEYGNSITGYTPQFISFDFPRYEIGFNADQQLYQQEVEHLYSNHFTQVGNSAYAKAVLDYIHEGS